MSFLVGLVLVAAGFVVLTATIMSIARLLALQPDTNSIDWARVGRIYFFGSKYVTGSPLKRRLGYPLAVAALSLYPVAFAIDQRYDNTGSTLHFFLLSRLANLLCQSCTWPACAFFLDSLKWNYSLAFFALGELVLLALLVYNPMAFLGYWPPFMAEFQVF